MNDLATNSGKPDIGDRLASMLIDHFVMSGIAMIFSIPYFISMFVDAFNVKHAPPQVEFFGPLSFVGLMGFALYLCKDSINGRSIAKRAMKLQVVNESDGQVASPLRCLARNILCFLWPLEVLVTLINPSRRIGDRLAGTRITKFDPTVEQPKSNWSLIGMSVATAYLLVLLLSAPLFSLNFLKSIQYVESSFNEASSLEFGQSLESKINEEFQADVRIYDEIEDEPILENYVSIILILEQDLLEDDQDFDALDGQVKDVVYEEFEGGKVAGTIKYVYREPNRRSSRTTYINQIRE